MKKEKIIHLSRYKRTNSYITSVNENDMKLILDDIDNKNKELNYSINNEKFTIGDIDLIGEAYKIPLKELERLLPITELAKKRDVYYESDIWSNKEPYNRLDSQKCENSKERYDNILKRLDNPKYCIIFKRKKTVIEF